MKNFIGQKRSSRSVRNQKRRQLTERRRLHTETLENRVLLAGDTMAWHNAQQSYDTNADGSVTAVDALVVINDLNANGARDVDASILATGMVDVNADGVVSAADGLAVINHMNSGEGEGELVRFRLIATEADSMEPLTTLGVNEDFLLRVLITDLTDNAAGVFSAYVDVTFDLNLAEVAGELEYDPFYSNGRDGDVTVPGLVDEAGSFANGFTGPGAEEVLLWSLPMTTGAVAGTLTLTPDAADLSPAHDVTIFGQNDPILPDEIEFVATNIQIISDGVTVTAVNDQYNNFEDQTLSVNVANGVLANDISPAGTDLSAVLITQPTNGTLTLNNDGSFAYRPAANFFGQDSFTYAVSAGGVNSNTATVSISIGSVNDAPVGIADAYTTPVNTTLLRLDAEGVLANDTDLEGGNLTSSLVNQAANGVVSMQPDGSFAYVPTQGFVGVDTFQYVASDGEDVSQRVTVSVTVTGSNTPITESDRYDTEANGNLLVPANIGVLANDRDPNGDTLSAELSVNATNGNVTLLADGSFQYQPNANFTGLDTFSYVATDGENSSDPTVVSISVGSNTPPQVNPDSFQVNQGSVLTVTGPGVLGNDTDAENDTLTASLLVNPTNGTLSLNSNGSFTYTPNADFTGDDMFGYTAIDATGLESFAGVVTITVVPAGNSAPIAANDAYDVEFETVLLVPTDDGVLANDSDPDGDAITARLLTNPSNGFLNLNGNGSFSYIPNAEFSGEDSFTYAAVDDSGLESFGGVVTLTVRPADGVNHPPVANNDSYSVQFETVLLTPADTGVLANDSDPDGDAITARVLTNSTHGFLNLNPNGSFSYIPDAGFTGMDLFTYTAIDTSGVPSFGGLVILNVGTVENTAPEANDEAYAVDFETVFLAAAETGVLANDSDADGDTLSANIQTNAANGFVNLNLNGSFSYIPNPGFSGVDSFSYTVSDGSATSVGTTTLMVGNPVGDASVQIRLQAVDSAGNVLTDVDAGDRFDLRVYVDDTDAAPILGVFAAYMDITWNPSLANVVGSIEYASAYPNGRIGDASTPGLVNEVGAFAGNVPLGAAEQLLLTIPMQANGGGTLVFATNPADDLPFGDVLLYDTELGQERVPVGDIEFGSVSLTVEGISRPVAVNDVYDAPATAITVSAADGVLRNDQTVEGETLVAMLDQGPANGTLTLNSDGSFTYAADPGFIGIDTFTYRAVSVGSSSEPGTVTVRVGDLTRSSIGGAIYFDTNNSGVREPGEHAFGGTAVTLSGTDILGQSVQLTTITDANGNYNFANLLTGSYVVEQAQPAIVIDGIDSVNGERSDSNNSHAIELAPAVNLSGFNFGERGLHPAFWPTMLFRQQTVASGVGIGLTAAGDTSWFCTDSGWSSFRSVSASVSGNIVTIRAIDFAGNVFGTNVSASDNSVRVVSNELGTFVNLTGASSTYNLVQVASAEAATDAAFGNA